MSTKDQFLTDPDKYRQLVWDYNMEPKTFFNILDGKEEKAWFNQDWAIARVLEHANYYEMRDLIPLSLLANRWKYVRSRLFQPSVKNGYEYLLHRYALSSARQGAESDK